MPVEDLVSGWREMQDALPAYELAERMYSGKVEEIFASPKIRAKLKESGKEYRFPLVRTAVNVMDDRVEIESITADSETATKKITEVYDANDMDVHYADLIHKTNMYGDGYLMVWPVEDDTETDADDDLVAVGVELSVHNPKNTRMFYDPEDERRKTHVIKRWEIPNPRNKTECLWRVELHYPDTIESWVSRAGQDQATPEGWEPYLDRDDDGGLADESEIPNPWGEIPFFHYRTELPYGEPVHAAGYGCQHAITKLLITQLSSAESDGFPQRYGLIDPAGELDSASDGPDWVDDNDANETSGAVRGGGVQSDLRSGPGTLMAMAGYKSVGQFAAADPAVFTDPVEMYIRLMAALTRTPIHSFDPGGPVPSGESLKVADAPTNKKARRLTTMFRSPTVETWKFILDVLRVPVSALEVRWVPAEVATTQSDWETINLKQEAGVPQDMTLIEAGYEPTTVEGWLDSKAEAMDIRHRVDLLNGIADAIQKFGTGVGLGVVSPEEVSKIMKKFIVDSTPEAT